MGNTSGGGVWSGAGGQDRGGSSIPTGPGIADIAASPNGSAASPWTSKTAAPYSPETMEAIYNLQHGLFNTTPVSYGSDRGGVASGGERIASDEEIQKLQQALWSRPEVAGKQSSIVDQYLTHHDSWLQKADPYIVGGAMAALSGGALGAFGGAGATAGAGEAAAASDLGMLGATSEGVSGGVGAVGVGAAPSYSMLGPAGVDAGTPIYSDAITGGTGPVGASSGSAGLLDYDGSGSGGGPGGSPGDVGPQDYSIASAPDAARFSSVGLTMDGGGLGLTSTASGASGGSAPFSMPSFISSLKPSDWLSIAGGGLGLYESDQNRRLAKKAASMQDPFAPQRAQYADQLAALSADPSTITKLPGYKFGLDQGNQALLRTTAARGYTGSGNEAIALQQYNQNYAQQWLNSEQSRLAQLAGGNAQPNGGNQLLQGNQYATDLMSKALSSIGYGLGRWGY